jgi:hypothetical protein
MSVRSSQSVTVVFTTRRFDTGAATNADSLPTGTLYVNGTADAATVTVTNITTGRYKAAVTLPTLAVGDVVDLNINATVNSVTDNAVVWRDIKDVLLDSSGKVTDNLQTGDSFARIGSAGAGLTALGDTRIANLDAAMTTRMASYTQPTGFLAATFPGTVASTTNITAGTITTATNVTTVNGLAAAVITAASIAADAITAAKIADGAIDTATFATGTTLPRVTLVDTLTTYTGDTPQTGDSFARIGATGSGLTSLAPSATALSTVQWTNVRATLLDNLDATVSSRSTYAGADTTGTTTLLGRVTGTVALAATALSTVDWTNARATKLDNLDAAISTRASATVAPSWYTTTVDISSSSGTALVIAITAAITSDHGTGSYIRNTEPPSATTISTQVAADLATAHGTGSWQTATGFSTLTTSDIPTTAQIADKLLGRNLAGGSDGGRTVTDALRFLRNRWTRTATTLVVYTEDDTTQAWTSVLTSDSTANPAVESNPA